MQFGSAVGWEVDAAEGTIEEIVARYARVGHEVRRIRQLGPPFARSGLQSAAGLARSLGWWLDPFRSCWRAPDEFITQPYVLPCQTEVLASAFAPPCAGWMWFVLATADQVAGIQISYLYTSDEKFVSWLAEIARGAFPRAVLDEEGAHVQLHTFPVDKDLWRRMGEKDPPAGYVRLCLIRIGEIVPRVLLDTVIARRVLVRSIYDAWRTIHDDDPARFRSEWRHFGRDDDDPERPFQRSTAIEEWLATGEGGPLTGRHDGPLRRTP